MLDMNKYLLFLLILTSTNALAAITKWVDSNGQVHYSDQPPPSNVRPKTLLPDSDTQDTASSGVAAPKTIAEREAELKKAQKSKKEATEKAAQKQSAADAQQASCAAAQQNLRDLQSGIRMVEIDAKGERSYIDDNQREQRVEKAQKGISNYCK
jgi:Domain of unknown function (DUF4124)